MIATDRACGDCRACCKVFKVEELSKPRHTWCRHAGPGGCSIYATRPESCREFACLWLVGLLGLREDERPDRSRIVVVFPSAEGPAIARDPWTGEIFSGIAVHELHQGAASTRQAESIVKRILDAELAVIVNGECGAREIRFPNGNVVRTPYGHPNRAFTDEPGSTPDTRVAPCGSSAGEGGSPVSESHPTPPLPASVLFGLGAKNGGRS